MARAIAATRPLVKNLLIVCEGTGTEPTYFNGLKFKVNGTNEHYYLEILPKPKDIDEAAPPVVAANPNRKTRSLKGVNQEPEEFQAVEEQYKSQPSKYVRVAQMALKEDLYEEVWAVFDQDGHPDHQKAYDLASEVINDKVVNIAYSGVSFEVWVLLHFELNVSPFYFTHCRTDKRAHHCGDNVHEHDCQGEKCLAGYLKVKGYLPKNKDVKHVSFASLEAMLDTALINARTLRKINKTDHSGKPYFEINPYTDVDKLVFKLLHLPIDYSWSPLQEEINIGGVIFFLEVSEEMIKIKILNNSGATALISTDELVLVNLKGEQLSILPRNQLLPGAETQIEFKFIESEAFEPAFLAIKTGYKKYLLSELPC